MSNDKFIWDESDLVVDEEEESKQVLEKHCGVCEEDDFYAGAPIARGVTVPFPNTNHANGVEIIAMVPPGLDPKPALWKPEGDESQGLRTWIGGPQYVREEAAYRLDRALGFYLVPVAYVTEAYGEVGAAIYYTFAAAPAKPPENYDSEWIEKAGVFDYIICQKDRGFKHNYLTHPDEPGRMILFDNGLSFPGTGEEKCHSPFEFLWQGRPVSDETMTALSKALADGDCWSKITALVGVAAAEATKARIRKLLLGGWNAVLGKGVDFDENEHPRADDGKFTAGAGGGGGGKHESEATRPEPKRKPGKPPPKKPEAKAKDQKKPAEEHPRPKDAPEQRWEGVGGAGPGALGLPTEERKKEFKGNPKGAMHENGGSYRRLRAKYPPDVEIHHMPADTSSTLHELNGPAIPLPKAEHELTASYGTSRSAQLYRQKQYDLIREGKFEEAQKMDIDDIREKFGNKYDKHIEEMLNYSASLKKNRHGLPQNPTPKAIRAKKA